MNKEEFKKTISSNISAYGHHITIVTGGPDPRFAYTIGLKEKYGVELILAGGIIFLKEDIYTIINSIAAQLNSDIINRDEKNFEVDGFGLFKLQDSDKSWNDMMMLGVFDYFEINDFRAFQIIPNKEYFTLDIPNMSIPYDDLNNPVWKWLKNDWKLEVPKDVAVVTNLDALKGYPVTEVMRWENLEWELFSGPGPEVEKKDIRVVPLGVMLGIDHTLNEVLSLTPGKGIWREDKDDKWHPWG